jgi:hypothetical protein
MHPNVLHFRGEHCMVMHDYFTRQGESAHGTQWNINQTICIPNYNTRLYSICLMPDNFTCQGESTGAPWVNPGALIKEKKFNELRYPTT